MALIFLVEARNKVVELARHVLMGRGHKVRVFPNFSEALKFMGNQKPDAVLVNPEAPERISADKVVDRIHEASPDTLIFLMLSDRRDERSLLAAFDAGVSDVLMAPLVPAEIAGRVAAGLRQRSRKRTRDSGKQRLDGPSQTRAIKRPSSRGMALAPHSRALQKGELSAKGILDLALTKQDHRLRGRIFDCYRLERTLGIGGMGIVMEATHKDTGHRVALKVLRAEFSEDSQASLRFLREAYVLQAIDDRNVVKLEDIGRASGTIFYAMEYVDGFTLADRLDEVQRLSIPEACGIAAGVAKALAALARRGVVHRDVKPSNIFLGRDGRTVKLGDFGLAKRARARDVTPKQSLIGTPHYIAPEVVAGNPADPLSDLYSLGVCFHEMLCGHPLHGDEPTATLLYKIVHGEPPDVEANLGDLPVPIRKVAARATHRYPEQRYRDAAMFARELLHLAKRFTPRGQPARGSKRNG